MIATLLSQKYREPACGREPVPGGKLCALDDVINAYGETLADYLSRRSAMIYRKVRAGATLQVRWHSDAMFSYPYPPRLKYGSGTRGHLVAIYGPTVRPEWIEEDLLDFGRTMLRFVHP